MLLRIRDIIICFTLFNWCGIFGKSKEMEWEEEAGKSITWWTYITYIEGKKSVIIFIYNFLFILFLAGSSTLQHIYPPNGLISLYFTSAIFLKSCLVKHENLKPNQKEYLQKRQLFKLNTLFLFLNAFLIKSILIVKSHKYIRQKAFILKHRGNAFQNHTKPKLFI